MQKHILVIVGLPGAGKSLASNYLSQKTSWPKIHFGDITSQALKAKGLLVSEQNERDFRESIRAKLGMAAFAILNLPKIKEFYEQGSVLLESFYSWEEYLLMKKEFGEAFKVLAVFASPKIRLSRLVARKERPVTSEEFISRDYSQIENLHQAGPIARADFTVLNEHSQEELFKQLDFVVSELLK